MYFSIHRHLMAVLVLALSALVPPSAVRAATLPAGFAETVVASGLANPTAMEFAPDGRLFVGQQGGRLRVIKNGALLATPFVTLTVNSSGERGLLGVTFDPDFATNNFVYVYYTATTPNVHNRISRFTANGDVAVASSEVVILNLNPLSGATNHNGGAIHFGEDGKLYAAVGDNANGANAQTLANLLGKILRINADGSVPTDNPFYGQAAGVNRAIWALGLRNPYTFSIEPVTGRMFINDVGQNTWEEIDEGVSGSNYGWPDTEGPTSDPRFDPPVYAYQHGAGTPTGCAITGGAFYNPQDVLQFPASYDGDYFFADYCSGWIYKLDTSDLTATQFATGISSPVDLKVSDDGALYYLARGSGSTTGVVARITYANTPPSITSHPSNRTVAVGQSATFSVTASGAAPLSYQWQRNGANIAGATSSSYTLASAQASDNGARFRAVVTNPFGTATSNEATLTVTSNMAPVATITQPAAGSLYSGGQTINFAGSATDAENGTLPASAFTWEVVFHHDTHIHPFIQPTSGITSGSFVIPTTGETAANVWYRIHLTVRDSAGLTHTTFRDVLPRTATGDRGHEPGWTSSQNRRPARHGAYDVYGRRRNPADAHGRDAADFGRHDLRVPELVGRRRGAALDLDAGVELDLHGDVRPHPNRRGEWPLCGLLRQPRLHGRDRRARRPDGELRLGRRRPGARHRAEHLQRAVDRAGAGAGVADLHVLHDERRRRPSLGQRSADHQQLDRPRPDREQRHDRAHRGPAVRHQNGVLRERRRCRREALVERSIDAQGDHSAEPALLELADRLRRQDQLPTGSLARAGRIPEGRRRGVRRPRQRIHLRLERGDPRYT